MSELVTGSASVVIARPPSEVFATIADVTRMGEWSPENTGARWVDGADGPAVGARFEGDNEAKIGPVTLKKWTTVSEVTVYEPTTVFEFVAEGYTTWRYEFEAAGDGTRVTESVSHAPYTGWQKFAYETVMRRSTAIVKDMQRTLDRLKAALEA